MKKSFPNIVVATLCLLAVSATGCKGSDSGNAGDGLEQAQQDSLSKGELDIPMRNYDAGSISYLVADIDDQAQVYQKKVNKDRCFIVISKREYRLYVYEANKGDTTLVAHFPVCYAKYPEAKQASGDMRTPESTMAAPFRISQIQNASDWHHDFGDGRGSIRSYGDWFMRLETPGFKGIGIHGSTNNAASVPGRDSEGCIRLRDADLIQLHDLFAQVDQPVIIKGIGETKYPFERKAQAALGDKYVAPELHNPLFAETQTPSDSPKGEEPAVMKRTETPAEVITDDYDQLLDNGEPAVFKKPKELR